ncbi:hypothetical protein HQ590_09145 [bacterium]|nr:hypothetical protein [bacterium]
MTQIDHSIVSATDRRIVRDLGQRVAEIAALPEQREKAELWFRVNRIERGQPPVLVSLSAGAWEEMPESTRLVTTGEFAQGYERDLRKRIYHHEHLNDDRVVTNTVPVPLVIHDTGWGVEAQATAPTEHRGAKHYECVLKEFSDLDRIRSPQITVDWDATGRQLAMVRELFDGVLEAETAVYWGNNYGCAPMDTLAVWRGFDQLFLDLIENPAFVHEAMNRIVAGHIGVVKQLESQNALHLNNGPGEWVSTVAIGYTDELPAPGFDPNHVRLKDVWGGSAAQIFARVSPAMHEEFCLHHERAFLELFGLTCYGCCEPLDGKVSILKSIPNLRRISMSPWVDVARAAEQLGDRYVFAWKPNPAIISGESWDPAAACQQVRGFLEKSRGCIREMILKDIETVRDEPRRLAEWLQVAREEIAKAR